MKFFRRIYLFKLQSTSKKTSFLSYLKLEYILKSISIRKNQHNNKAPFKQKKTLIETTDEINTVFNLIISILDHKNIKMRL